jgi:hypothetical protein
MLLVLIVVAIKAEQFPVASVGRIIVVVVVPVVDRELTQFLSFEFPTAPTTYMGKVLQRLLAVALLPKFPGAPGISDKLFLLIGSCSFR